MDFLRLPFFTEIEDADTILLAGRAAGLTSSQACRSTSGCGKRKDAFHLEPIARRNLYLNRVRETETYFDLRLAIEQFRRSLPGIREWTNLPL